MSGTDKQPGRPLTRASTSTITENAIALEVQEDTDKAPAWAKALHNQTIAMVKSEITAAVDRIDEKFANLLKPIQKENVNLRSDVKELQDDVNRLREQMLTQQGMISYLNTCVKVNQERQIRMESYSMRENIVISGIDESRDESEAVLHDKLRTLFSVDMSADMSNVNIVRCHRLRKSPNAPAGARNVIVRFSTHQGKISIMKSARNLKGRTKPIYINDQLPKEINSQRGTLRTVMQLGKKLGKRCSIVHDKLMVAGVPFTVNDLEDVPFDISGLATKQQQEYVLFNGRLSPFSNFYTKHGLFTVDGTVYCSSEQYFQRCKAVHAKDYMAAAEIMNTSDPVATKRIGEKIKPSTDWSDKALAVMETGVRAKFAQNHNLITAMNDTGTRAFQECNRYDNYWGIGLSLPDAIARVDHSQVKGQNVMGTILVNVRDYLANIWWTNVCVYICWIICLSLLVIARSFT